MRIGIAFDLKGRVDGEVGRPDDILEEHDTPETVAELGRALRDLGHDAIELGGGREFLDRMVAGGVSDAVHLVFNMAEGRGSRSREAHVPAVCEILGVAYTHSDPLTLAVTLDKELTKRVATSLGIPTAPFKLIAQIDDVLEGSLPPFPLIAKPNAEGSSMGIRRHALCRDRAHLLQQIEELLANYRQPVLVEEFLPGVEVTVAVTGSGAGATVLGAMEIAPRNGDVARFIYGVETKRNYLAEVDYYVPPRLSGSVGATIDRVALAIYRALGCRDIARIDFRLDGDGCPHLLEVNALPGLDPVRSDVPILCRRLDISYHQLIDKIVRHAADRWRSSLPTASR